MAERVGWALRARACRCAAAPVERGSKAHTSLGEKTKRPREGAFSFSGGGASHERTMLLRNNIQSIFYHWLKSFKGLLKPDYVFRPNRNLH